MGYRMDIFGGHLLTSVEPTAQATQGQSQWPVRTSSLGHVETAQVGVLGETEALIWRQP